MFGAEWLDSGQRFDVVAVAEGCAVAVQVSAEPASRMKKEIVKLPLQKRLVLGGSSVDLRLGSKPSSNEHGEKEFDDARRKIRHLLTKGCGSLRAGELSYKHQHGGYVKGDLPVCERGLHDQLILFMTLLAMKIGKS